jgi:hypothetical protein
MRPANLAKSASFSMRALALRMMVFLRSFSEISLPTERRSSRSISASGRQRSRPMEAKAMRLRRSVPSQKEDAVVGGDGDHEFLVGILGAGLLFLAEARALGAVEDVVLGGLEVALAHEFLLHHVLDVLDVDEGLVAAADALGDARAMSMAGSGFSLMVRKAFLTAISILVSDQGTTLPLRRIRRTGRAAGRRGGRRRRFSPWTGGRRGTWRRRRPRFRAGLFR